MCKFLREMNHAVQNYVSANLMLWTMKKCAKIVLILQCCNSALFGQFLLKNHTYVPKLIYFQSLLGVFAQDVTLGGCLSKYRQAFIVYMSRRPPEVWSLVSDNALISGTGKASIQNRNVHVSVLNGALWDMEQVHSGICQLGQLSMNSCPCSTWCHGLTT